VFSGRSRLVLGVSPPPPVWCCSPTDRARAHADGCDTRHPVGFVEGWYVESSHRDSGVGRPLMRAAEEWARSQGCHELASDTWIDHESSQRAHEALGFEVVDRCVHFRKALR
jgi:aminoglycoside 6'-N-acetyltransferase I